MAAAPAALPAPRGSAGQARPPPLGAASRAAGGGEATSGAAAAAPAWTAPRRQAGQGSGAPRPPRPATSGVAGRGLAPSPPVDVENGRRCPAALGWGRGASSGFHLLLPTGALALFPAPLFVLLALYSRCSMGPGESGEEAPRSRCERAGGCRSRLLSASPEPGAPLQRCRCYRPALPGAGRSSRGTSVLVFSLRFRPPSVPGRRAGSLLQRGY